MEIFSAEQLKYHLRNEPVSDDFRETMLEMFKMGLVTANLHDDGHVYFSLTEKGEALAEEANEKEAKGIYTTLV